MVILFLFTIISAETLKFSISSIEKIIKVTPEESDMNRSIAFNAIPLTEIKQEEFTIKIGFGYPPQILNIGLNLVNSYSFVSGESCYCHNSTKKYNPNQSHYKQLKSPDLFGESCLSFYCEGYWLSDGLLLKSHFINDINFLMLTWDNIGNFSKADGFLGLGKGKEEILSQLVKKGFLQEKRFSIYISSPHKALKQSALTLGYWDSVEYAQIGPVGFMKTLEDRQAWMVETKFIIVNGKSNVLLQNITFDVSRQSIIMGYNNYDIFFLPYIQIWANCFNYTLDSRESYLMCDCSSYFPTIGYISDHGSFLIFKENYLRKEKNGLCTVLIQRNNKSRTNDIIGLPFFKTYYTMFDAENNLIYFKESINNEFSTTKGLFNVYQSAMSAVVMIAFALGVIYIRKNRDDERQIYLSI